MPNFSWRYAKICVREHAHGALLPSLLHCLVEAYVNVVLTAMCATLRPLRSFRATEFDIHFIAKAFSRWEHQTAELIIYTKYLEPSERVRANHSGCTLLPSSDDMALDLQVSLCYGDLWQIHRGPATLQYSTQADDNLGEDLAPLALICHHMLSVIRA